MPFNYRTICKPDKFWPFEYRNSPVFGSWLYLLLFCDDFGHDRVEPVDVNVAVLLRVLNVAKKFLQFTFTWTKSWKWRYELTFVLVPDLSSFSFTVGCRVVVQLGGKKCNQPRTEVRFFPICSIKVKISCEITISSHWKYIQNVHWLEWSKLWQLVNELISLHSWNHRNSVTRVHVTILVHSVPLDFMTCIDQLLRRQTFISSWSEVVQEWEKKGCLSFTGQIRHSQRYVGRT